MANPFVHVELNSSDVGKARAFYQQLFNWSLTDHPMPDGSNYTLIDAGEGTGGGMVQHPMPGAPSMWLAYVAVDDIHASTEKAKALGASVLRDVTVIPQGSFSILADPAGAVFALWKPA